MLQEVNFSIPRIVCHLDCQNSEGAYYLTHRILPSVPAIGDMIFISTSAGPIIGEVVKHIWHINDEYEDANDYVTIKIRITEDHREATEQGEGE